MHWVEENEFFFAKFHDDAILKQSVKKRYINPVPSRNISLVVCKDDKAICFAHRAENSSALIASESDRWSSISSAPQDGALEIGASLMA